MHMHKVVSITLFVATLAAGLLWGNSAQATRVKDLVDVEGVRENSLVGYGLVVGLAGTGDDARSILTRQSIAKLMLHLGIQLDAEQIKARNVAAVLVSTKLPSFSRPGSAIDVTVSSIGTAKSLSGGTLIATPLKGPDRQTYAVAQGSLSLGGFAVEGASGSSTTKNHATVAQIPGGAIIERPAPGVMPKEQVVLLMRQADFTTATRLAHAINAGLEETAARVHDPGRVVVRVPARWRGHVAPLVAYLEGLDVIPDAPARVVIDERTGTIVVGANVGLAATAIAHGGITVTVDEQPLPSQPNPGWSEGETVVVPGTTVEVQEAEGRLTPLAPSADVGDVAAALNSLGVKPRDLVAIFRALKAAGALHAQLEIL